MSREYSDDGWGSTPPARAANPVLSEVSKVPESVEQPQIVEEERVSNSGFVCAPPAAQRPDASVNNSVHSDRRAPSVRSECAAQPPRPVTPVEVVRQVEAPRTIHVANIAKVIASDSGRRSVFDLNGPPQTEQPPRPATSSAGTGTSVAPTGNSVDGGLVSAMLTGLLEVVIFAGKKAEEILAAHRHSDC